MVLLLTENLLHKPWSKYCFVVYNTIVIRQTPIRWTRFALRPKTPLSRLPTVTHHATTISSLTNCSCYLPLHQPSTVWTGHPVTIGTYQPCANAPNQQPRVTRKGQGGEGKVGREGGEKYFFVSFIYVITANSLRWVNEHGVHGKSEKITKSKSWRKWPFCSAISITPYSNNICVFAFLPI